MSLSYDFLKRLHSENDIESVVSSYVSLKRSGQNFVGLCPFHNEKTPSFTVYPSTQSFYCFGCACGGDVITFIKKIENLDYMESVRLLADRVSLALPQEGYDDTASKHRSRMYEANRCAARFFYDNLVNGSDKSGLDYFHSRSLDDKTIRRFGLGFAPDSWDSLYSYMRSKGFTTDELLLANLIRKTEKSGKIRFYDNFRNRVMFPIIDLRGNIVAFGGRVMDDSKPKYVNTSDTPVYKKGEGLFALNEAKNSSSKGIILVEGYMDVIALHQAGFGNAIACLGTALTSRQAHIISRYTDEVIVCYDSDEAGQKATRRAIGIFNSAGIKIRVATISGGKDADEIIRKYGAERFRKVIETAANDTEYALLKLKDSYSLSSPDGRLSFLKSACKLLASLDSGIERDIYSGRLSQELQVDKKAILLEINNIIKSESNREKYKIIESQPTAHSPKNMISDTEKAENLRAANAEEKLIAHLMFNNDRLEHIKSLISADDFVTCFNSKLFRSVCLCIEESGTFELSMLSAEYSDDEMGRISGIQISGRSLANTLTECNSFIKIIKEEKEKKSFPSPSDCDDSQFLELIKRQNKSNPR